MKIFTCTDFDGVWPVGTSAIIVAETIDLANFMLRNELIERNLNPSGFTLQEIDINKRQVVILQDGDY